MSLVIPFSKDSDKGLLAGELRDSLLNFYGIVMEIV